MATDITPSGNPNDDNSATWTGFQVNRIDRVDDPGTNDDPPTPADSRTRYTAKVANTDKNFQARRVEHIHGEVVAGTAGAPVRLRAGVAVSDGAVVDGGAGTPEGVVAAPVGSLWMDTTNGLHYRKETGVGDTGWVESGGGGGAFTVNKIDVGITGMTGVQFVLAPSSTNGLDDLSGNGNNCRSTTTETYDVIDGVEVIYLRETTRIDEDAGVGNSPELQIVDDLTVYATFYLTQAKMSGTTYIFGFGGTGETAATNILYALRIDSTGHLESFHESGSGTDNLLNMEWGPQTGRLVHVCYRRTSKTITLHHNGLEVFSGIASNEATGGTSGEFFIASLLAHHANVVICNTLHSVATLQLQSDHVGCV